MYVTVCLRNIYNYIYMIIYVHILNFCVRVCRYKKTARFDVYDLLHAPTNMASFVQNHDIRSSISLDQELLSHPLKTWALYSTSLNSSKPVLFIIATQQVLESFFSSGKSSTPGGFWFLDIFGGVSAQPYDPSSWPPAAPAFRELFRRRVRLIAVDQVDQSCPAPRFQRRGGTAS